MTRPLEDLLRHRHLWRATDGLAEERGTIATGFEALDAELAGHGWPRDGLTELLGDVRGVGELRLLLPALARLSQRRARWIAWIAPPWVPYAPALAAAGVDVDRVLLVHPKTHQDQLWATEQALRSGTCSAVLSWPDPRHLRHADLRRLQLAAREGDAWGVLFRPAAAAETASPAELRVALDPADGDPERLALRLLKRRGGWPTEAVEVRLQDTLTRRLAGAEQASALRQLALWRPADAAHGRRRTPPRTAAAPADVARLPERAAPTAGRRAPPQH
jgi:cell division inhibitor SulA